MSTLNEHPTPALSAALLRWRASTPDVVPAASTFEGIAELIDAQAARIVELEAGLATAFKIAEEARQVWGAAPSTMKAGKLLIALGGNLHGYRADIDAIHALLPSPPVSP
jgi:hypothetical protein